MIRAVTFDAAGTLIYLVQPPGRTYADIAANFGLKMDAGRVQEGFKSAWKNMAPPADSGVPQADDDRIWWRDLVAATIATAGYTMDHFEQYFESVYEHFRRPGVWELYADIPLAIEILQARQLRLGIISNFDRRLYDILDGLAIRKHFEQIVISSEVGVRKPAARIFGIAADRFGLSAGELLHIGDEPSADLRGAARAGCNSLLVDREQQSLVRSIDNLFECLEDG